MPGSFLWGGMPVIVCKDPHRFCAAHDGLCCRDCADRTECDKDCTWKYSNCFLGEDRPDKLLTTDKMMVSDHGIVIVV